MTATTIRSNDAGEIVRAIYEGVNVYANYSGQVSCFNVSDTTPGAISADSWNYQACTEFIFPMCSNGVSDMFEPSAWNYEQYANACEQSTGVGPRGEWLDVFYGATAQHIRSYSNIVFSNGGTYKK